MASPFRSGEILLGDSHEFDADISPFDKSVIDELMLRELRKIIQLNDWTIRERWHGIYAKHPALPGVELEVEPGVYAITGMGGSGMTMSFGLAERTWMSWMGEL
jgi:glycine/D-amino acid oxidase-like deaminating enzyme